MLEENINSGEGIGEVSIVKKQGSIIKSGILCVYNFFCYGNLMIFFNFFRLMIYIVVNRYIDYFSFVEKRFLVFYQRKMIYILLYFQFYILFFNYYYLSGFLRLVVN